MPTAFDHSTPKSEHNPLSNLLDFDPSKPLLDLGTIFEAWQRTMDEFIIPIVKDLTGIDLSSPEAFFASIALLVINGGTAVAEFVKAIVQPIVDFIVNALTGGNGIGNPLELLQPLLAGLAGAVSTAMNSANQAADLARQVMGLVTQIVQGLDDIPVIGDLFEGIQAFAFWVLGWFGITRQSVTDTNPAVAAANGRIAALESINTVGLEGFSDHFNRDLIGPDWTDLTPIPELNIQGGTHVIANYRSAGRYTAKTLLTDNFHVQVAIGQLEGGFSNLFVACPVAVTDAGVTSGCVVGLDHQTFPFNRGGRDILTIGYLTGGGLTGGTVVASETFDYGNIKVGDVVAVEYYDATNTFYVFVNNNEITGLRWTDTANHVPHGPGHREVALMNCSIDNSSYPGPGWDDLSAYDIKVA